MSTTSPTLIRTFEDLEVPAAGTWSIDPVHSTVGFLARHLLVAKVRGRFQRFDGQITVGERPEDSRVDVVIDASSIDTSNSMRDDDLRSPSFLDVAAYPTAEFHSTAVERIGATHLRVVGDLTLHGVTKPVVLDVTYDGITPAPEGGAVAGFSARAEIDRDDFGITFNEMLETGGFVVGKKVAIEIEVEARPSV